MGHMREGMHCYSWGLCYDFNTKLPLTSPNATPIDLHHTKTGRKPDVTSCRQHLFSTNLMNFHSVSLRYLFICFRIHLKCVCLRPFLHPPPPLCLILLYQQSSLDYLVCFLYAILQLLVLIWALSCWWRPQNNPNSILLFVWMTTKIYAYWRAFE